MLALGSEFCLSVSKFSHPGGGQRAKVKVYRPKQAVEASRVQDAILIGRGGRSGLGHLSQVLEDVIPTEMLPTWTEGGRENEIREGGMTTKAKTGETKPRANEKDSIHLGRGKEMDSCLWGLQGKRLRKLLG